MSFRVRIDAVAARQIDRFVTYLRDYSEDFAVEQIERLDRILRYNLAVGLFPTHGSTLSCLFVSRRTANTILDRLQRR